MENDLINRQAAIDAINQICPIETEYDCTLLDRADVRCVLTDLPSAQPEQPEIIRCKDCKHKPYPSDNYDYDNGDCGFEIIFPDYRCPCRCEDEYYNRIPDDDWFCGNAERRTDE